MSATSPGSIRRPNGRRDSVSCQRVSSPQRAWALARQREYAVGARARGIQAEDAHAVARSLAAQRAGEGDQRGIRGAADSRRAAPSRPCRSRWRSRRRRPRASAGSTGAPAGYSRALSVPSPRASVRRPPDPVRRRHGAGIVDQDVDGACRRSSSCGASARPRSSATQAAGMPVWAETAARARAAGSRPTRVGLAPSRAKASAAASPMPLDAPVMSTRLPSLQVHGGFLRVSRAAHFSCTSTNSLPYRSMKCAYTATASSTARA